jgi:hypothetical protein
VVVKTLVSIAYGAAFLFVDRGPEPFEVMHIAREIPHLLAGDAVMPRPDRHKAFRKQHLGRTPFGNIFSYITSEWELGTKKSARVDGSRQDSLQSDSVNKATADRSSTRPFGGPCRLLEVSESRHHVELI